jgi:hypothetical protein
MEERAEALAYVKDDYMNKLRKAGALNLVG